MIGEQVDCIRHEPVMVEEVLFYILERTRNVVVDCTLGDGGHSWEILSRSPGAFVLGIDVDDEALAVSDKRLGSKFRGRVKVAKGDYRELPCVLARLGVPRISGVLFDLGVSSRQIDKAERGFSYWGKAPLDMRMNPAAPRTAGDILLESSEDELECIIREYGEERFSRQIARAIVTRRIVEPITTTEALVDVVIDAIPSRARREKMHPARRTFQALRIATNDELSRLAKSIRRAFFLLEQGGILMVISYHSLEDRIAKNVLKELEAIGAGTVRAKKVIRPSEAEIERNSRSRSAKLRVIQR
ncbi:MAG TPA: 16S rRNA (cytosine(1402)-N(4))-methyltransferase RsmH [Firmicutes bacterium]|jgi:16S rRNA (cytosine1402-N4)-methyltransferase|nr:16S rRNA (cytosine(1402)-N(4))-methyltransferase RsmH [Bacillota bacterium]